MPRRMAAAGLWALPPLAFLAAFFFYPLARIVGASLDLQALWSGEAFATPDFPYWGRVLGFTLRQATVSTAVTLGVGLPIAWWMQQAPPALQRLVRNLLTIPFVMPTIVVAAAFTALVGPRGWINEWLMDAWALSQPPVRLLHTFALIVMAHVFYNVSVVVRIVSGFWSQLDWKLVAAASTLGATAWQRLRTVELPLILPSLLSAALLVFLFCFSSFGVVLILGGLRFATLEVEIYRQAVSFFDLRTATLLSLAQMGVTFAVMYVHTYLQRRSSRSLALGAPDAAPLRAGPSRTRPGLTLLVLVWALLFLLPLAALAARSVSSGSGSWTFQHYQALFRGETGNAFLATPLEAIGNSVRYGAGTMLLSVSLGLCMAYTLVTAPRAVSRWLDPAFLLPLGTSAVTLGLGFILSMGALRTSPWLVPVAHALMAAPFVLRVLLPALRRLPPSLREASAVLGASPRRTWRHVDLPLLLPAVVVAGLFAFLTSLGEFGATLLIARPQHPTIPLVIHRALGQPGLANLGQAMAMSAILMCVSASAMLVLDRVPAGLRDF